MTEVWFRNPSTYIKELVECGESRIAWDRGFLVKKRIDPISFASLYYGQAYPWRVLLVGQQGTAEFRNGSTVNKPFAVYPTFVYGMPAALLEDMLARPVGEDVEACTEVSTPKEDRPVQGQEHRVVVTGLPVGNVGVGRQFLRYLKELQEDYPKAILHVHGLYSYKLAFGMGFAAADTEARTLAAKGKVTLPSGNETKYEHLRGHQQWIEVLGFKPVDLEIPRNRCMFNIKSALWAGEHYDELYNFKVRGEGNATDFTTPQDQYTPPTADRPHAGRLKAGPADKFLCDSCSLQNNCKYFRNGAVCSVPGAEPVRLAKMFNTRNADDIIDGLGTLLATNSNRLERGLRVEQIDGELDPEVSKTMGQVFEQGVKLAKLLEPQRFSPGTRLQVNVGAGGAAAISASNPRQLVAAAYRELEQQGFSREKITEKMIQGVLEGMVSPESRQKAIKGTVISSHDESEQVDDNN